MPKLRLCILHPYDKQNDTRTTVTLCVPRGGLFVSSEVEKVSQFPFREQWLARFESFDLWEGRHQTMVAWRTSTRLLESCGLPTQHAYGCEPTNKYGLGAGVGVCLSCVMCCVMCW